MQNEESKETNEENLVVGEKRETLTLPKKEDEEKKTASSIPYVKFKKVNDQKNALAEKVANFEKLEEEAKNKKLEEERNFKKLLEKKEQQLNDLNSNIEKEKATRKRDNLLNKINLKAQDLGAIDFEDIKKILDIDSLVDSDNEAIDEELNQLQDRKPYLFGSKKKSATDENNIDFRGSDNPKKNPFLGF